jgi:aminoglycoside phosphotransferase (APT) family kinase protein
MNVTVNEDEITADVAARLVAAQFPQWAGLPVTPVALKGQATGSVIPKLPFEGTSQSHRAVRGGR